MTIAHVTGTMAQPGEVSMPTYNYQDTGESNWAFELDVPHAAAQPLLAMSATHALARRDVDTRADDVDLGVVDVDATGVALVPTTLVLDGPDAANPTTTRVDYVIDDNSLATGELFDGSTMSMLPDSGLGAGDQQLWETYAAPDPTEVGGYSVFERTGVVLDWRSTLPTHQALLPLPPDVTWTGTKASWDAAASDPAIDELAAEMWDTTSDGVERDVVVYSTANARAGGSSVDLDTSSAPGYDAGAMPDPVAATALVSGGHFFDAASDNRQFVTAYRIPLATDDRAARHHAAHHTPPSARARAHRVAPVMQP